MRGKVFMVLTVLGLAAAASALAAGQGETAPRPYGPGWRGAPATAAEEIALTGRLSFQDTLHPVLESGGKEYQLMVPRFYAYAGELQEGQSITVKGFVAPGRPWRTAGAAEEAVFVRVTAAVVDGKEISLGNPGRFGGASGVAAGPGMGRMAGGSGPRRGNAPAAPRGRR